MRKRFIDIVFLCALFSLIGCDSAPGVAESENQTPVLSNLTFEPFDVRIDDLPGGTVQNGVAQFALDVSVDVRDADGDLDRLFFMVLSPVPGKDPVVLEELVVEENGPVKKELLLRIPVAEIGVYTVKVFAADLAGQLGNQVVGSLLVDALSEPPVIVTIQIPDRVTRPAPGAPAIQIPIVAEVMDPDGLANILSVEVEINGASTFQLCDDGGGAACNAGFSDSGDAVAGDGLFTLTISLDSGNALGDNIFVFKAIDRAGLESETITRTITVE